MKKGNLSSALQEVSGRALPPKAITAQPLDAELPKLPTTPSREGKKVIAGYFDPAVSRQLKQIGLEKGDVNIQELLREALNDLFIKHSHSPIA